MAKQCTPTIEQLLSFAEVVVPGALDDYLALCDDGLHIEATAQLFDRYETVWTAAPIAPTSIEITRPRRAIEDTLEEWAQQDSLNEWGKGGAV